MFAKKVLNFIFFVSAIWSITLCSEDACQCGANEILKQCGGICEDSCETHFLTQKPLCAVLCSNETSCGCADGFVRNKKKQCIKPEDCPGYPNVCGRNEVLRECGKNCQDTCSGIKTCTYTCPTYKVCGCAPGYYLNSNNECVEKCQCPPKNQNAQCPLNEYSTPGGRACEATCSNPKPKGCKNVYFENPCTCLPGYLRDPFGNCVLPENCPSQTCPVNEEFDPCGASCEPTCDNPKPEACAAVCKVDGGCKCKKGFVRNANGNCVLQSECHNACQCGANEILKPCGGICEDSCDTHFLSRKPLCAVLCSNETSCGCADGFVRNKKKQCVKPEDCPGYPNVCGRNEVLRECGKLCQETCEGIKPCMYACLSYPTCGCAPGYVLNKNNECIEKCQCPQTNQNVQCPVNEYSTPGSRACKAICCHPKPKGCKNVYFENPCTCLPGFLRNPFGSCVLPENCPFQTCPVNEEFDSCGATCEPTCDNPNPKVCPLVCKVDGGCKCKKGFVRNANGNCVLQSECHTCPPNEIFAQCGDVCEPTCKDPNPKICPYICKQPACTCREGFVRAGNGSCVREYECPGFHCDVNESLQPCGRGPCEPTCLSTYLNQVCYAKCSADNLACGCNEGLVRNSNGNCIDPSYCPPNGTNEQCPINEYFAQCGGYCESTCDSPGRHVCFTPLCRPGDGACTCLPGYLRNKNGKCVTPSNCPNSPLPTCGVNEVAKPCGHGPCEPNCANYQNPPRCLFKCPTNTPTCGCMDGFVRNPNGNCVDPAMCPPGGIDRCPINEYNKTCGRICEPSCSNPNPKVCPALACTRYGGCACLPGFLRDEKTDTCVQPYQCNQGCGPNAEYSDCASLCPETCSPEIRFCPALCVKGCTCKPGYVSSKKGCILREYCPPEETCYSNQIYNSCGTSCPLTCRNYLNPPTACNKMCNPGCFCKDDGYVLTDEGTCVLPENCPANEICPNDHMVFKECGTACPITCKNINNPPELCIDICVRGCFCEDGYVQAEDGTCVKPEQCPTSQCGPNQVYNSCGSSCPDTCDNYLNTNRICTLQCVAGCFCQKGYVNDTSTGQCMLPENCPCNPTCGRNEVYLQCGSSCPDTCDNYLNQNRICTLQCVSGCFCQKGYVRDTSTGMCVLPGQCPIPHQCGVNEVYLQCGSSCPDTCDNYLNQNRICTLQCVSGCFCQKGYVRDTSTGMCVIPGQCPIPHQCGLNEVYLPCGSACPDTCDNYLDQNRICTRQCVSGCFCQKGYVRDTSTGMCVIPGQCSYPSQCGVNEIYTNKGNGCLELCDKTTVRCTNETFTGCFCKPGYLRDYNRNCVPENQCPNNQQCGSNEFYNKCGNRCSELCDSSLADCSSECVVGCFCQEGYSRDGFGGNCIPKKQCPNRQQCSKNEVYTTCGYPCGELCNSTGISCVAACAEGCFCQDGFARGYYGDCIPRCECSTQQCGSNEEYIACGNRCSELCDAAFTTCMTGCSPGCFCKKGFLRDANKNCIPEYQCPSRQCGINEIYLIDGPQYDTYCSSNNQYNYPSSTGPNSGCFCIDGYARDENYKCIPVDQCPHNCGCNQIFKSCGTACPDTCQNLGTLRSCLAVCVAGCFCMDGYVQDDLGRCILPEECPAQICPGPNEVYTDCLDNCPLTCENLPYPNNRCGGQAFPQVCRTGCQCDLGFARNGDGICIPVADCPIRCKTPFEVYSCGSACDTECAHLNEVCPIVNIKCNDMCYCIDGYARNSNWECVPIENCDKPKPICYVQ